MLRKWLSWSALGALFCSTLQVEAVELDFQASVDRTRAGQADPIRLTLTISADETLSHMPAPQLSLKEFEVEGPELSTRSEVQIINSNITSRFIRELTYTLYPRKTGTFIIGPARLRFGGKVYETKPVAVQVVPGSRRRAPLPDQSAGGPQETSVEGNLFVQASSDRDRVYVGQQVTLNYDLFYRFRLYDVGFKEIPSFAGFWAKELFVAQQLQAHREEVDGVPFNVAPLRQMALFPTSAGVHRVGSLVLSCEIPKQQRRRSLFDDFGFGLSTQKVVLRSPEVEIEVLPLPEAGQPLDFTGAVGRFALQARAQPVELPVGDPVTLRVEVSGQGNMATIKPPDLEGLQGFKLYEPKMEEQEGVENGLYGGSRIFEYILIPEREGLLEIPPVRLAFFDPFAATYRIAQSTPIRIGSQGTAEPEVSQGYWLSRQDIQVVGQDIRYIKPDLPELDQAITLYKSGVFWMFQGLFPLVFLGLRLYQRHQRRLEGDVAYARRRRARGEAFKRLRQARQLMQEGQGTKFYAEVQRALTSFMADHFNLAAAGLTSETCAVLLREKGVEEEVIRALDDLLGQCDFARFAPTAPSPQDMDKVQEEAERLLTRLEELT